VKARAGVMRAARSSYSQIEALESTPLASNGAAWPRARASTNGPEQMAPAHPRLRGQAVATEDDERDTKHRRPSAAPEYQRCAIPVQQGKDLVNSLKFSRSHDLSRSSLATIKRARSPRSERWAGGITSGPMRLRTRGAELAAVCRGGDERDTNHRRLAGIQN
jgi:hypothetical protein